MWCSSVALTMHLSPAVPISFLAHSRLAHGAIARPAMYCGVRLARRTTTHPSTIFRSLTSRGCKRTLLLLAKSSQTGTSILSSTSLCPPSARVADQRRVRSVRRCYTRLYEPCALMPTLYTRVTFAHSCGRCYTRSCEPTLLHSFSSLHSFSPFTLAQPFYTRATVSYPCHSALMTAMCQTCSQHTLVLPCRTRTTEL